MYPGYFIIASLQIFHKMRQWKNFEYQQIFGEDMDKSWGGLLFGPPCIYNGINYM